MPGRYLVIPDDVYKEGYKIKGKMSKRLWTYKCNYDIQSESKFKNLERYWEALREKQLETYNKRTGKKLEPNGKRSGVYGLYRNGKLIYIGYTSRNIEDRVKEHMEIINGKCNPPLNMKLYNLIEPNDKITYRELIVK